MISKNSAGIKQSLFYAFGLIALFLSAIFLRIYDLSDIPYVLYGDEAQVGIEARKFFDPAYPPINLLGNGYWGISNAYFYAVSIVMILGGNSIAAVRFFSVIGGSLTIVLIYLIFRRLLPREYFIHFLGLILITFSAYHIHFSRIGIGQIYDPFFACLLFYIFLRFERSFKKVRWVAILGGLCALSQYFFYGTRMLPVLVGVWFLIYILSKRPKIKTIALWIVCFTAVFLSIYTQMIVSNPKDRNLPFRRMITFGVFTPKQAVQGKAPEVTDIYFWYEQLIKPYRLFIAGGDKGWFYLDAIKRPVIGYGVAWMLIFIAFSYKAVNRLDWLKLVSWIILAALINGSFALDPPHSQRLIIMVPAVIFLICAGMSHVLSQSRQFAKPVGVVLVILILISSFEEINFYFTTFQKDQLKKCEYCRAASYLGRYLGNSKYSINEWYFLAESVNYYSAQPSLPFLTQRYARNFNSIDELTVLNLEGSTVMGTAKRLSYAKDLKSRFPNSTLQILSDLRDRPVAWVVHF